MTVETISSRRMRALEMNAEYFGISALQLMENAGRAVAEEIGSRTEGERCLVVCGCGRNGGDGFVAARHLASLGFDVAVTLVGSEEAIRDPSTRRNWEALRRIAEIPKAVVSDSSLLSMPRDVDVIVDALLGIGIKGDVRPPLLQAIRAINEMDGFKVAVDIPSGINPDTGEVMGEAVRADLTVTFHRLKTGLPNAREYTGEVVVKGIGLPPPIERYVGPGDVYLVTKERVPESHKGDFGRLLIVGGSETYSGAPALAALAALRTGVDLTFIAAPERTAYEIASLAPDLITIKLRGDSLNPRNVPVIRSWLGRVDAVVMGPGLGLRKETTQAVTDILSEIEGRDLPVLLDADGLKAFAELKRTFNISKLVLTPHAGELMLLTGRKAPKELSERASQVRDKAKEVKATILLKGPVDVISDGLEVKYNFTGNPGMTVGGTGDTLSGIIGAFLAQGFGALESACAGAFINGVAGDLAAQELGYHLIASDLIERIPQVMKMHAIK